MSYEGIVKKLYRRGGISFSDTTERGVGSAISFTWTFPRPGYISFDYMCNVPVTPNGELTKKYFRVYVNGVKRFEARAGWAWNRAYIYVDEGEDIVVRFETVGYTVGDSATIRRIIHRHFTEVDCLMVESTTMPKSMETVNAYSILDGFQRYQRTGRRGTELEFVVVFQTIAQWKNFMKNLEQGYVLKGDYGVYGGTLLPQETETVRRGGLIFLKTKMNSPLSAGVGVDGL